MGWRMRADDPVYTHGGPIRGADQAARALPSWLDVGLRWTRAGKNTCRPHAEEGLGGERD